MTNLLLSYTFAAWVFIPVFIIALAMLRSPIRALVLAATFTAGGAAGYLIALAIGRKLLRTPMDAPPSDATFGIFLAAAAIAGGMLAVFILSRLSKDSLWRKS